MTRSSILRPALALMSLRLVLQQVGLALLVFALSALWLRIPDASAVDLVASVLLAILVLAIAIAGESVLILRIAGHKPTSTGLIRGAVFLLAGVALWFACSTLLEHLYTNDPLVAGYLNSRFPHSMRNFFSYEHILFSLGWMWTTLKVICVGLIALFVVTSTATSKPRLAITRGLRSLIYWIVVVVGMPCAIALTHVLMQWTPGHGLRIEMLSLALRLTLAVLADGVIVCLLLAILAVHVRQSDGLYSTPSGAPDESQPRTVGNP